MECYYCNSIIPDAAIKCRYCGGWISRDGSLIKTEPEYTMRPATPPPLPDDRWQTSYPPQPPPYPQPQPQPQQINVMVKKPESSTFAVITLILYLFTPLGFVSGFIAFIMNIIGMISGPKKGCFVQMFIFFVVIPLVIVIVILAIAADALDNLFNRFYFF